jgi:tetratricopeptide (TPR) repeat protein
MHRKWMQLKAGRWLLFAALTVAPSIGCKSGVTFWNPFAKPAPVPGSSMLQSDGDQGYVQPPMPQEPRAEEFGWTTTPFKKLGETVSSPFKKSASTKPKAKPATAEDDPISLTSKQAPAGAKLYITMAQLQVKAGNIDSAIEQYQKAIEDEPKNLTALLGIAHVYDSKGETTKALEYYKKAVKAHDQSAAAHNDLALCYYRNKQPKESIVALKTAIELEPSKPLYRNNLAKIYVEMDQAGDAYKTLVSVHGEAVAHYNVGYMLKSRSHNSEALAHFQAAAKLDPTLKPAQHWVNVLSGGESTDRIASSTPVATPAGISQAAAPTTRAAAPAPVAAGPLTATPIGAEQFAAKSTAPTPVAKPSSPLAPASLGPRYSQVSAPVAPPPTAIAASREAAPEAAAAVDDTTPVSPEAAASVLAAARAVAQQPLSAGSDNVARSRSVPLKTVDVPTQTIHPPLNTPIATPIVVPGRNDGRSAVDDRALEAAGGSAGTYAPPAPPASTPTPLPAPSEEDGPRLGKRTRPSDANVVGDRYATGGRYGITAPPVASNAPAPIQPPQGTVPPLAGPYAPSPETATRPTTAARYPAGRY